MAWYPSTKVKVKFHPYSRFKSNWLLPTGGNGENVRPYQPTSKQPRHWHQTVHWLSLQGELLQYLKTLTISSKWEQSDILHKLKVIASEDWNGMREDFKMASDVITFRVDYAPRVSLLKYLFFYFWFCIYMCSLCLLHLCVLHLWFSFCSYVFL